MFKKLNFSLIHQAIIVLFSIVNTYKFCKKRNFDPPGEPREQHLGDTTFIYLNDYI